MSEPVRILLVTSDREHCGVRAYGQLLIEHLSSSSWGKGVFEIQEFPHTHPDSLFTFLDCPRKVDLIHLNHHAALHSAWREEHIEKLKQLGYGVVVTHHDTFEKFEIMQERGLPLFSRADQVVVHEEIQIVPNTVGVIHQPVPSWNHLPLATGPLLGLFGFDFPWKNFDKAVSAAQNAGWDVRVISPDITIERSEELQDLASGRLEILPGWQSTEEITQLLSQCTASAFLYVCGNSGTSGAIRMGIAAGRPVLAYRGCRQFRDLLDDGVREAAISWVDGEGEIEKELTRLATQPDYWQAKQQAVRLVASLDSWAGAAVKYAALYVRADGMAWARRKV